MEMPLGQEEKKLSIEEQYAQGPGNAPEIGNMQMPQQQSKEERLSMVRGEIEDLRVLVEYDRLTVEVDSLIMKQMENWVMLGKIPVASLPDSPFKNELQVRINDAGVQSGKLQLQNDEGQATVPGLQGLEMLTRHISSIGYLTEYRKGAIDAAAMEKEMKEELSVKHAIIGSFQYDGKNAGQLQNFIKDLPIEDAPILSVSDPRGRVSIQVVDADINSGYRELSFMPNDWAIKDENGAFWSVPSDVYKIVYNK